MLSAVGGSFSLVDVGLHPSRWYGCGLKTDGSAVCWGPNDGRASYNYNPPEDSYTSIGLGGEHGCGVRSDGFVACWGHPGITGPSQMTDSPSGSFTYAEGGFDHSCGLKTDGSVACWGNNNHGQTDAPSGTFTSISVGGYYTCGLRADASIECWGRQDYLGAPPPQGSFTSVSVGVVHACALNADGSVVCWGDKSLVNFNPPGGTFTSVSAGQTHTCGLRPGGGAVCWGDNEYGKADPAGRRIHLHQRWGGVYLRHQARRGPGMLGYRKALERGFRLKRERGSSVSPALPPAQLASALSFPRSAFASAAASPLRTRALSSSCSPSAKYTRYFFTITSTPTSRLLPSKP